MTTLKIEKFVGLLPSVSPRNLGAAGAQVAHNLMSGTTEFVPVKKDTLVCTVGIDTTHPPTSSGTQARTLFRLERNAQGNLHTGASEDWIVTSDYRSYARTQIKDNTAARTCYSFDDKYADATGLEPRIFDATGVNKKLGVPAPAKPPTVVVLSNEVFDAETREGIVTGKVAEIAKIVRDSFSISGVGYPFDTWPLADKVGFVEYTSNLDSKKYIARVMRLEEGAEDKKLVPNSATSTALFNQRFGWILDNSLTTFEAISAAEGVCPSWQVPNKPYICLPFRSSAASFVIDKDKLKPLLAELKIDSSSGAADNIIFTSSQIDEFISLLEKSYTPDGAEELSIKAKSLATFMTSGSSATSIEELVAFYESPAIVAELKSVFDTLASDILRLYHSRPSIGFDPSKAPFSARTNDQRLQIISDEIYASFNTLYGQYQGVGVRSLNVPLNYGTVLHNEIYAGYLDYLNASNGSSTTVVGPTTFVVSDPSKEAISSFWSSIATKCNTAADKVSYTHFSSYSNFPYIDKETHQVTASDIKVRITELDTLCKTLDASDPTSLANTALEDLISDFLGDADINSKLPEIIPTTSEDRAYGVTWVTKWGEESAMSFPSDVLKVKSSDVCAVTRPELLDADKTAYQIEGWRLYRSSAGMSGAAFQLVPDLALMSTSAEATGLNRLEVIKAVYAEINRESSGVTQAELDYWNDRADITTANMRYAMLLAGAGAADAKVAASAATCRALLWAGGVKFDGGGFNYFNIGTGFTKYEDAVPTAGLSETLQTSTHLPPPVNLQGLVNMPNGVMAGFFGNTVCFSEPYKPHAWPIEYQMPIDYPVVKLAVFGQTLFVGTMGSVSLISGASPVNMSQVVLPGNQTCVSAQSVVAVEGGVVFASPDGLCMATLDGVKVLTKGLFLRAVWQKFNPETIRAAVHDGVYLFSYQTEMADWESLSTAALVSRVYADFGRSSPPAEDVAWWVREAGIRGYGNAALRWVMLRAAAGFLGDKTKDAVSGTPYDTYAQNATKMLEASPVYGYYALDLATGQLNSISSQVGVFFADTLSDNLMYAVSSGSSAKVMSLRTGALAEGLYSTGITRIPSQKPFSWAHVEADGPVTLRWIGDSKIRHQITFDAAATESVKSGKLDGQTYLEVVTNTSPARLPPGRYIDHEIQLFSSSRVTGVTLAGSTKELQEV